MERRGRPAKGGTAKLPTRMGAVNSMSVPRSFGMGLMLAVANPKNILFVTSAGLMIAAAGLRTEGVLVTVIVFIVLATLSIEGPYVAKRVAPERVKRPLREARDWLFGKSAAILATLLLVIGVSIIGEAIGVIWADTGFVN